MIDIRALLKTAATSTVLIVNLISWPGNSGQATAREADPFTRSVTAAFEGRYEQAMILAGSDSAARKLIEWIYLRRDWKEAGAARLLSFIQANPHWPQVDLLQRRGEQLLLAGNPNSFQIIQYFAERQPLSTEGKVVLARTSLAMGDTAAARTWAVEAWMEVGPEAHIEQLILSELGGLLNRKDDKARLLRSIFSQDTASALRVARRLDKDHQTAARVVKQLVALENGAPTAFNKLRQSIRNQPAMRFALARYYRRTGKTRDAAEVLLSLDLDGADPLVLEALWSERRVVARDLLRKEFQPHWKTAYRLAATHGDRASTIAAEGEFLAGWIALRFLNEPETAQAHFKVSAEVASARSETVRAFYWLGRSYNAAGTNDRAIKAYKTAATGQTFYYGQLAREALGAGAKPIAVAKIQLSQSVRLRIENDELVRAYRMLASSGHDSELGSFLNSFLLRFTTEEEVSAVAGIVWDTWGPHGAVKLAKAASARNIDIDGWAYPIKAIPTWKHVGPPVEKALIYGLARQESEFNPRAGSRAGAQGLMQLMPGTAQLTAKQYRLPYKEARLLSDPVYNVTLGSAHLGDLLKDFNGSYILSLAAYNAGPRRSREWLKLYGDPRAGQVDPIDWVELIPFTETRLYVQKVLQNTQVYRSRLAPAQMQGLTFDLTRGAPDSISGLQASVNTVRCSKALNSIVNLIACN